MLYKLYSEVIFLHLIWKTLFRSCSVSNNVIGFPHVTCIKNCAEIFASETLVRYFKVIWCMSRAILCYMVHVELPEILCCTDHSSFQRGIDKLI